jgi:hypothetical protein
MLAKIRKVALVEFFLSCIKLAAIYEFSGNKVHRHMATAQKSRVSKHGYSSPSQLPLPGFETPFVQNLFPDNRWIVLARKIPWDTLVNVYQKQMHNEQTGAGGINPRVVLGAIIIKHMCDLSDRETVLQIQENMYMQYFIGYSSFSNEEPFDASLFVAFRKRLGADTVNLINEKILGLHAGGPIGREPPIPDPEAKNKTPADKTKTAVAVQPPADITDGPPKTGATEEKENAAVAAPKEVSVSSAAGNNQPSDTIRKGKIILDATACPQDIAYPTDLDVLNEAREKSEELIDILYALFKDKIGVKPKTYRELARTNYLKTAQKKHKTKKEIRRAVKGQLQYLHRNINRILNLLKDHTKIIPFDRHQYKYLLVIQTLYDQQFTMFVTRTHTVEHRIVSIHQPHVRPIVRGKANAKVEFGAKINVSLMNGFAFLEDFSWEAFNESTRLTDAVERYKKRFGYYPEVVLVDKIYCTRENRRLLKQLKIALRAKPLGRPKAVEAHVSPGERNPIEGKFGQAKTGYGMNRIKARLSQTSESWIASIIMVLNLVKLAGQVSFCLKLKTILNINLPTANNYNRLKLSPIQIWLPG